MTVRHGAGGSSAAQGGGKLRKISVAQARVGMYLQALCGAWIETPFWHTSFLIASASEIDQIRASGIAEMWIDLGKGLDVLERRELVHLRRVSAASLQRAAAPRMPASWRRLAKATPSGMAAELGRAASLVSKSRQVLSTIFDEARMGRAVDVANAMPLVDGIAASVIRNPAALIGLVRLKNADNYTYLHSIAVCALMIALSRKLGLDDYSTRELGLAGLLHDIGKSAIPIDILNKPGRLTDAEFAIIQGHPEAGHRLLLAAQDVAAIPLEVCLHHHEKLDGSGYPHGLAGDAVSLHARMGAVCDVYDAITSERPYKRGWCPAEALRRMGEWSLQGHLDPAVLEALIQCIGIYPVGTLVRLTSGRLGVVAEQQAGGDMLQPRVRVFFSSQTREFITPVLLDLALLDDAIVGSEAAADWGLDNLERYWLGEVSAVA